MPRDTFVITGTGTGVGKTVVAALLIKYLRTKGLRVAGLKPICSGGRADARLLKDANPGPLTLDQINPWHFRAAVTPLLAARMEQKTVQLSAILKHVRKMRAKFQITVVEGAGGLLSPLGENFCTRDIVAELRAIPVIVCPNRLGAINELLLNLEALPAKLAQQAQLILMNLPKRDRASRSNKALLGEFHEIKRIHELPFIDANAQPWSPKVPALVPSMAEVFDKVLGAG